MSKQEASDYKFEYKQVQLEGIQLEMDEPSTTEQEKQVLHGGKYIKGIIVDDELITPSPRFWTSLYARFGLNKSFFTYFDHDEVFKRVSETENDTRIRLTIERNTKTGDSRLLSATGLRRPVVIYDDLMELLEQYEVPGGIRYSDGIVTSTHQPRVGNYNMDIAGDTFRHEMRLMTPIDGYGRPDIYLSLLRLICSNGMVAMSRRFKTALTLGQGGDNISYTLRRTLDNFNNEEGFAVLRERFEAGANSWASLAEQQELYSILLHLQNDDLLEGEQHKTLMKDYRHLSGDVESRYFGANTFTSEKKMRALPTAARVYELLNFATEIATHRVSEDSARRLNAWVGDMLSEDFDLEDSCDQFDDWRGFFATETRKIIDERK